MFEVVLSRALPHGLCVGVRYESVKRGEEFSPPSTLDPSDVEYAMALPPLRRKTWLGGRVALRSALAAFGVVGGSIPSLPNGAPALPDGFVGSLSHKETFAVAIVSTQDGWTRGIDIEPNEPDRRQIARRIISAGENDRIERLPEKNRWPMILACFCVKEAIYKSLFPDLQKIAEFRAFDVDPLDSGEVCLRHPWELGDAAISIEARWQIDGQLLLATARSARPTRPFDNGAA